MPNAKIAAPFGEAFHQFLLRNLANICVVAYINQKED